MKIIECGLDSREFLIQFWEILQEFGTEIPWLEGLKKLRYVGNSTRFRDMLLTGLKMSDETGISPLQLVTSSEDREYVGGVLRFERAPEKFKDRKNLQIQEELEANGSQFLSCLQIRTDQRGGRHGPRLVKHTTDAMLARYGSFWAVVSDMRLIHWYESFGANLRSRLENQDGLWIISWNLPRTS